MADQGVPKEREQVDKSTDVPAIEVSQEGATGGLKGKDGKKKNSFEAFADKITNFGKGLRSRSVSPKNPMESQSMKEKQVKTPSPAKNFGDQLKRLLKSKGECGGGDDERLNLCEQEITEHSKMHLAPPEKDVGIASLSPTDPMAEKCDTYDKSSSVSSAPSGYSSLPDDDCDTDATPTSDCAFPSDDKQKSE